MTAGLLGQWAEAAMLVFLYSISEAAEGYTEERTRNAIRALMELAPETALIIRDNKEITIPAEALQVGDVFIVKPSGAVATDGDIIDGHSSLNQAPVTGESVPVEKQVGDSVFAATLNGEGALIIKVTRTTANNTLARIIQMVEEAQYLIKFSRRNWKIIQQNLILSVLVIASLVIGAMMGVFSLLVAVIAHEISEFVVIASGLKMLKF